MREKKEMRKLLSSGILLALFLLLIVLLKTVDVQAIGPEGSSVGLAAVNGAVHRLTGVHLGLYHFTGWLGYGSFAVAIGFVVLAALQLLRRKSLQCVDRDLYLLGATYVLAALLYVFFEKVIINYRPVILEESLEASFPSSHTMLAMCILGPAICEFRYRIRRPELCMAAAGACMLAIVLMVVCRLISGVHWFTDILGGALLGGAVWACFDALFARLRSRSKRRGA